jgi:hypothetical protein
VPGMGSAPAVWRPEVRDQVQRGRPREARRRPMRSSSRGADVGEGPAGGIDFVEGAGGAALGDRGGSCVIHKDRRGSGGKS